MGSICCVLHAVAVAVGSSAGAVLFGSWMVKYRPEFLVLGFSFMLGMFLGTIRKHGISSKRALVNHMAIMSATFLVVFGLLNVFLAFFK